MPRYHVHHVTTYDYSMPVSIARHLLHLSPRALTGQTLASHLLHIDPPPTLRRDGVDAFGNARTLITIEAPHRSLSIAAESEVEVRAVPPLDPAAAALTVAEVRARNAYHGGAPVEGWSYLFASPYVRPGPEVDRLVAEHLGDQTPLLAGVDALCAAIYRDFRYEPGATGIGTPLADVIRLRTGVCQDFAHLAIACLRRAGVPARYVSGYLLTDPPPGQARLRGVDASHAWCSVCLPGEDNAACWVDVDPTNGCRADTRYVTLGWGRDFGDVSPVRGVILGGGEHALRVEVTVWPVGEPAPCALKEAET